METINFKSINNNIDGNSRHVCHFLNFANTYKRALYLAKKIGGKKFHNQQYGGGIVFESDNLEALEKKILQIKD